MIYFNARLEELDLERALAAISAERREYALRYREARDRKLAAAVYLLLKEGLRAEYGIGGNPALGRGANGKPFLRDYPGIHFSFSHCPVAVACAIAEVPVGVDVEEIAPVDRDVAEYVTGEREMTEVEFARRWTRGEAEMKVGGEWGRIDHELARISTKEVAEVRDWVMGGYVMAVAMLAPREDTVSASVRSAVSTEMREVSWPRSLRARR